MKNKEFRFREVLTDLLVLLTGTLLILYPGRLGYASIQQAKFDLFLLLFGGYAFLMLLFSLELMLIRHLRPPSLRELWRRCTASQRLIILFWLFSLVSTLASPYGRQALWGMSRGEGFLTITLYCAAFLGVSSFARPKAWWCGVFGGAMTLFDGICLLQLRGFNPLGLYPQGYSYFDANVKYGGIYLGTTGNADLTAALLTLAIPLCWVGILRLQDRLRWLLLIPLGLSLVVLKEMDVQAGLLAVCLGTLLTIPVVAPLDKKWRLALWGGTALLLILGFLWVWNSNHTWDTVYELREILHGNWNPEFGSGRVYIWQELLQRVPEHLLLGTGPDTMAAAGIPGYSRVNSVTGELMQFYVDVAHNEYLNVLFHQGILGLLPYVGALLCSCVSWLKKSGEHVGVAILGSAVLCYCIQAFFGFSMCQTAGVFWVIWGLLEREMSKEEEK